jgi:hypothetical protein
LLQTGAILARIEPAMPEEVRKPLTFLAIIFIGLAVLLGAGRVKAWQTFLPDFANGKDIGHIDEHPEAQELLYKVQPGDTWWKIAQEHSVSTRALLEANHADIGTSLSTGTNIHLPGGPVTPTSPASSAGVGSGKGSGKGSGGPAKF